MQVETIKVPEIHDLLKVTKLIVVGAVTKTQAL